MPATAKVQRPWERPASAPAASASNSATAIDELGRVREEIKTLEKREKELAETVKALGEGRHDGAHCSAVVAEVEAARLDTAALKAVLPEELIAKHTVTTKQVRVTIKPLV